MAAPNLHEDAPQRWVVSGRRPPSRTLVWGGHVRYGNWHVAVAHRPDLPSAPSVSCHGEDSPDADLLGSGVILQRRGAGEAPARLRRLERRSAGRRGQRRRTHAAQARPTCKRAEGKRADTTGVRADLRVPAVHADDLDVERALHARIGFGAARLPGHRSAGAGEDVSRRLWELVQPDRRTSRALSVDDRRAHQRSRRARIRAASRRATRGRISS